ncbi:MAG: SDR family NAD(P)-dependent oxidoreductase [Armatimonadetes bacterium]|nr:SDR family NAD(P)-dependent oxidoreductase [Armatimonadota bacterium]
MNATSQKTALVTGASSGMGKEIAKGLINEGYSVYVAARNANKMVDLEKLGARVITMDISKDDQISAAVSQILAESGGVDVLVNNAGFGLYGPVEEVGLDEARYQFEVNLFGPARLTQLLLPSMRSRGGATIVNIASMGGKIYTLLGAWYHATKHAVEGWSDCLRLELEPFGIRVVVIEPGLIETGFGDVVANGLKPFLGGPYRKVAAAVSKSTVDAYSPGRGTPPSAIAKVVVKAVRSSKPKTRYAVGKYAKPMIAIRKWFGDRAFDKMILSQMK